MIDFRQFTPVPFWFWNDNLNKSEIERQVLEFKRKGIYGFIIHPRIGLPKDIDYLSDRYFDFIEYAVNLAKQNDMFVILYDEAMYPSGSCHGEVVKSNPCFASKGLQRTTTPDTDGTVVFKTTENNDTTFYNLVYSDGTIRGIYPNEDDKQEYAPMSVDLLNGKAVDCFIEKTHERYYERLRDYFGSTIVGFFTDEPCILGRNHKSGIIPWTDNFLDDYLASGGDEKLLYALFDESKISKEEQTARECYNKAVYNRLGNSYYSRLSSWCENHGIALVGHPEKSTDIGYLKYFQIPCQDLVWRYVKPDRDGYISEKTKTYVVGEHSTMAKCSSDSARHRGKRRNGNEVFGCMGHIDDPHTITIQDMKWFLNYLFVRGVNLIIPHAFFYSVRGERMDERPPDLGVNSPLWDDMSKVADYIKIMCYLSTDSVNTAQTAILCSYNSLSDTIARPFYEHQLEFNYLETELLGDCTVADGQLKIAKQSYRCLVRSGEYDEETERLLKQFQSQGVNVINAEDPDYFDIVCSETERDVVLDNEQEYLRYTHIVKDNRDVFILTNEGENDIQTNVNFPTVEFITAFLFDPFNRTTEKCSKNIIKLTIMPNECKVIYFQM